MMNSTLACPLRSIEMIFFAMSLSEYLLAHFCEESECMIDCVEMLYCLFDIVFLCN